jgi:endoglucanase
MPSLPSPPWKRFVCGLILLSFSSLLLSWNLAACQMPPSASKQPFTQLTPKNAPDLLRLTWTGYKKRFLQYDGRVIDYAVNETTTSEGQSYALLRAVWMNDPKAFATTWEWTQANMPGTSKSPLPGWLWGEHSKTKRWGVLERDSASDADEDIALALLMAWKRWGNETYFQQARTLIQAIWSEETASSKLGRVFLPGNFYDPSRCDAEDNEAPDGIPNQVLINPSYLAPYAYRYFALVDKKHPWMEVVQSSYALLKQAQALASTGLPGDWVHLNRSTGEVKLIPTPIDGNSSVYSYDAFRTAWRFLLDKALFFPEKSHSETDQLVGQQAWQLDQQWKKRQRLPGPLSPQGQELGPLESNAPYGVAFPVLSYYGYSQAAQGIRKRMVLGALNAQGIWEPDDGYYANNWLWFGVLLWSANQPKTPSKTSTTRQAPCDSWCRFYGLAGY